MMHIQKEIFLQCYTNFCLLIVPIALVCNNTESKGQFRILEVVGILMWVASYIFESVADNQKMQFIKNTKKEERRTAICNVGLWHYCRHPNYFGEWMVWNSLCVIAIPSIFDQQLPLWQTVALVFMLISVSAGLYDCLTVWTGAKPAEYFSVQKRPAYKQYQETTNMLIPWFPKNIKSE